MQKTQVQSLIQEDLLEKKMETHSSILAWEIPQKEESDSVTVHGVTKQSDMTEKLNSNNITFNNIYSVQFISVQSISCVHLFTTPWTAAHQASLSITNSQSLLKLISTKSVMPSNYLILSRSLPLPSSIFHSIRVLSNESGLHIRWPKCQSFSFSISSSNEYSGLISFRMD